jgi:hypothetical protein
MTDSIPQNTLLYPYSVTPESTPEADQEKLESKIQQVEDYCDTMDSQKPNEPLKQKIRQKLQKLVDKLENEKTIRRVDKVMFVIGMLRLAVESFLLGRFPCQFYLVYTLVGSVLLISRFCYYRWMHWHYFMLDFCYLANLLTLLYLWVWPQSVWLYSAVYSYSMGPLLIAIPLFHNAFVPHSLDRMTSIFIHIWPSVTLWTLRHSSCEEWPAASVTPSFIDYCLASVSFYVVWFVAYTFIIFYAAIERCEKKQNLTLFKYTMSVNPGFAKLCGMFGETFRKPMFMLSHICTACLPLMATYVTLYSYYLQAFLILLGFLSTLSTSANYFMDIFSKNYDLRMKQLEELGKKLN